MIKCNECACWLGPKPLTAEEEKDAKLKRLRERDIDVSEPLEERPGTCHLKAPTCEIVPGPMGLMNLTLWPQVPGSEWGCDEGKRKEE